MIWNTGAIAQVIAEAKSSQKVFLVFICGKDELSISMNTLYNDPTVEQTLKNCLGIRLEAESEQSRQFSQIYPVMVVPSSYFIGTTGVPLEVVAGSVNAEEFVNKINAVYELHRQILDEQGLELPNQQAGGAVPSEGNNVPNVPVSGPSNVEGVVTGQPTSSDGLQQQESQSQDNMDTDSAPSSSASAAALDDRIERAKQLVEMNRLAKLREEQDKERQQEIERRKTGLAMAQAKEQKRINELSELARERAKEKLEDKLARDRVIAQIAQDRAERAARQSLTRPVEQRPQEQEQNRVETESPAASNSNIARLQFRLPTGQLVNNQFPADETTLKDLHDYVRVTIQPGFTNFALALSYPRRQFTVEEFNQTLRALGLVPSASLMIIPSTTVTSQAVAATSNGVTTLIWFILNPFIQAWNSLYRWVRGQNPPPPQTYTASAHRLRDPSASPAPSPSSGVRNRRPTNTRNVQKEGNVYHLSNNSDEDDDENTWNGNSTQQM